MCWNVVFEEKDRFFSEFLVKVKLWENEIQGKMGNLFVENFELFWTDFVMKYCNFIDISSVLKNGYSSMG